MQTHHNFEISPPVHAVNAAANTAQPATAAPSQCKKESMPAQEDAVPELKKYL